MDRPEGQEVHFRWYFDCGDRCCQEYDYFDCCSDGFLDGLMVDQEDQMGVRFQMDCCDLIEIYFVMVVIEIDHESLVVMKNCWYSILVRVMFASVEIVMFV